MALLLIQTCSSNEPKKHSIRFHADPPKETDNVQAFESIYVSRLAILAGGSTSIPKKLKVTIEEVE